MCISIVQTVSQMTSLKCLGIVTKTRRIFYLSNIFVCFKKTLFVIDYKLTHIH
jgi:hypothetical protein